jgi:hypothetical protein
MPQVKDYSSTSRFAADPDFKVLTRKGIALGTIVIIPQPVRGPGDRIYVVPLKHQFRWDNLCQELFQDPSLRTVLMRHNRISDPFSGPLAGDRLLVPDADQIAYYLNQG